MEFKNRSYREQKNGIDESFPNFPLEDINNKDCKKCGGLMFQIPRNLKDRLGNLLTFGLHFKSRYQCKQCGNQQLLSTDE